MTFKIKACFLACLFSCIFSFSLFAQTPKNVDSSGEPPSLSAEIERYLSLYLSIDTTNPPGNEDKACFFLKSILARKGIPSQIIISPRGGYNLISLIKGDGSERPLILLNHTDVSKAIDYAWSQPPFSGKMKEGEIYGRGALDQKTMAILELFAFIELYKKGFESKRDIVFLAVADSKSQGKEGLNWILENHILEDILKSKPQYVLGGGSFGILNILGKSTPVYFIANAEKKIVSAEIEIPVSFPHNIEGYSDIALSRVSKILGKINLPRDNFRPDIPGLAFLYSLADSENFIKRYLLKRVSNDFIWKLMKGHIFADPIVLLQLTNNLFPIKVTIPTGDDVNMMVLDAELALNKGTDTKGYLADLRSKLGTNDISMKVKSKLPYSESKIDNSFFKALKNSIKLLDKNASVTPYTLLRPSDLRAFRLKGIDSYGITPLVIERKLVHSMNNTDERVPVKHLLRGKQVIFEAVYAVSRK